jgi:hypothetical protein
MDTSLSFKFYPVLLLEGPRKPMKNLGQESRCLGRDSNEVPPEYKLEASPLYPTFLSVLHSVGNVLFCLGDTWQLLNVTV